MTCTTRTALFALTLLALPAPALACADLVEDYGADSTGAADTVPYWDQAMADEVPCLHIPAGEYRFLSQPAAITHAPDIHGDAERSILIRDYSGGYFMQIRGRNRGRLANLALIPAQGTSRGHAINLMDTDGKAAGWTIENIYIGTQGGPMGLGTFCWPIYIKGSSAPPFGIRDMKLNNITLFGMEPGCLGAYLKNVASFRIMGISVYGTDAKVWIDGQSTRVGIYGADIQAPVVGPGVNFPSLLGNMTIR